jgi:glycosyltransferase involved in cell wall biosynthesis
VHNLKISLITVVYNAHNSIKRCIESVLAQNYTNVEYIIIDGGSTDGTLQIIEQYKPYITIFLSETDKGIYDAMNKGIKLATGDIIGTLNSDDFFADNDVLNQIVKAFEQNKTDTVYGNLDYIDTKSKIIRKWLSGKYSEGLFNWGWMPPHPTFYCRRLLFERLGAYDLQYGTAADYELMSRFIHLNKVSTYYLNKTMVKMTIGGASNKTLANRYKAWKLDYKAMRNNGVLFPLFAIALKPLRKVVQYFKKKECNKINVLSV